jgi:8-amino-7-oxononanoate synthase
VDGDLADVAGLVALADEHDTLLLLDEAHATGVLGEQGRGLFQRRGGVSTPVK